MRTVHFDGEGSAEVNGGAGYSRGIHYGGGGAGGRIVFHHRGNTTFLGTLQAYGGDSSSERGGAGTVYIEDSSNSSTPYRRLVVNNNQSSSGLSRVDEIQELLLDGNPSGYSSYFIKSYDAPNGIRLSTSGTPLCFRVDPRNPANCRSGNGILANLFLSSSAWYFTSATLVTITYQFPLALFLDYLLVYPACGSSDYNTQHMLIVSKSRTQVMASSNWIDTTGCQSGQPGRTNVHQTADKVGFNKDE